MTGVCVCRKQNWALELKIFSEKKRNRQDSKQSLVKGKHPIQFFTLKTRRIPVRFLSFLPHFEEWETTEIRLNENFLTSSFPAGFTCKELSKLGFCLFCSRICWRIPDFSSKICFFSPRRLPSKFTQSVKISLETKVSSVKISNFRYFLNPRKTAVFDQGCQLTKGKRGKATRAQSG